MLNKSWGEPITVSHMEPYYKSQSNTSYQNAFIINVDCLRLLESQNKPTINITCHNQIELIIDSINVFLQPAKLYIDDLIICRMDFCWNFKIEDKIERELLFKLFKKMPMNCNYLKETGPYDMGEYKKNKSRCIQIYDKNSERYSKGECIKDYEKDVIRVEMQLKNEALKYFKSTKNTPLSIEYWLNIETEREYLKKLKNVFPCADFHSLKDAKKIVMGSELDNAMKRKLIAYLLAVARAKNMDTAKTQQKPQTNKKYIDKLVSMGINPVTIPAAYRIDYLKNPLSSLI